MVKREDLSPRALEMYDKVISLGFSESDAEVIADSILNKKSCSWVNTDPIEDKALDALKKFLADGGHRLVVSVEAVPTRGKYIWEVKALK